MRDLSEKQLHKQICSYIKLAYPQVIFNTDLSGLKMTMGQAVQVKKLRSSNAIPDIVIYEKSDNFGALFLEVKKETPYKKDGTLKKSEHLEEQRMMLNKLHRLGYYAEFVWTYERAKTVIDNYLKL